ncbi:MAG TPA: cellulase family glycosylhydrolase [Pyrinomonadaceae bacterium]
MKKLILSALLLLGLASNATYAVPRWTVEKANQWYNQQPWIIGANFIPSTSINQLEMWQAETFDPATIDRELGYAERIGLNTMRVFLHNLPYEQDAAGFTQRIDQYLVIADKHHIKTIFVLFDSCWNDNPKTGKQPAPRPGIHNSGWVRAPGTVRMFDSRTWGGLEAYTTNILKTFGRDPRVLAWDLFNEPSNSGYMDAVVPLLRATFAWAQSANPEQPLTVGYWNDHPLSNELILEDSDIVTFHNYDTADKLEAQIKTLQRMQRPMICTEYMARTRGSLFETNLPVFKKYRIGAINWGLVKGKTNTIFAWDKPMPDTDEPPVWFHDIFRPDGSAFSQKEVDFIKAISGRP